jgi:hypothetical protein
MAEGKGDGERGRGGEGEMGRGGEGERGRGGDGERGRGGEGEMGRGEEGERGKIFLLPSTYNFPQSSSEAKLRRREKLIYPSEI